MAEFSDTAFVAGRLGKAQLFAVKLAPLFELFAGAFETEAALSRPFLWLPVAAGSGGPAELSHLLNQEAEAREDLRRT